MKLKFIFSILTIVLLASLTTGPVCAAAGSNYKQQHSAIVDMAAPADLYADICLAGITFGHTADVAQATATNYVAVNDATMSVTCIATEPGITLLYRQCSPAGSYHMLTDIQDCQSCNYVKLHTAINDSQLFRWSYPLKFLMKRSRLNSN